MVGALTQHARRAHSQSAATFFKGAMLNYTTIDPYNAFPFKSGSWTNLEALALL